MDGTTAATIPIRDANGRMQAADPASGATDKTLVTANWVSQTGDSSPNNVLHRNGDETFDGRKSPLYNVIKEFVNNDHISGNDTWKRMYTCQTSSSGSNRRVTILLNGTRSTTVDILNIMYAGVSGSPSATVLLGTFNVRVCRVTGGNIEIWVKEAVYGSVLLDSIRTTGLIKQTTADLSSQFYSEPTVGGDFLAVVTPSVVIQ